MPTLPVEDKCIVHAHRNCRQGPWRALALRSARLLGTKALAPRGGDSAKGEGAASELGVETGFP